jgi:hypothetical protein
MPLRLRIGAGRFIIAPTEERNPRRQTMTQRRWALAWATLCGAFALHVIDEAANNFLAWYNANALAIRARLPWLPIPVFTFRVWITGLAIAVLALTALTPLVRRGRRWLLPLAYVYGVVHTANAIGHISVSIAGRWFAPGVYSSPVLLAAALWLLYETNRVRRRDPSPQ